VVRTVPFIVPIENAQAQFPEFQFVAALTPSAQKAAFHVKDHSGRDLCLKIIAPNQALDRVEREVLAMQALQHVNVVRLIGYEYRAIAGSTRHFLVEEFIPGNDLSFYLGSNHRWSTNLIITVFGAICDGLAELQANQIVHRDLKPSNIRIRPDGATPVIIDFGLARLLDLTSLTQSHEGAMIGTPRYFAPEQFKGSKRDIDHRTDLYALGVLIYEAAVGRHPSHDHTVQSFEQLSDAVCSSDSFINEAAFRTLPRNLQLIVRRLLEKERAKRPASASVVASVLRGLGGTA
jgi:serine/threonine protein kinase